MLEGEIEARERCARGVMKYGKLVVGWKELLPGQRSWRYPGEKELPMMINNCLGETKNASILVYASLLCRGKRLRGCTGPWWGLGFRYAPSSQSHGEED